MNDRQIAAKWAYDLLKTDFAVLDTETTGKDKHSEIVQISMIDPTGRVLLDSLVKPTCEIEEEAIALHGINDKAVEDAPIFPNLLVPLLKASGQRSIVIYHAEFDLARIRQSLRPYGIQLAFPTSDRRQCRIWPNGGSIHCAMHYYALWVAERNEEKGNLKWQKLPGSKHSGIEDCQATLAIIRQMAASYSPQDPVPPDYTDDEPNDITTYVGVGGGR